MSGRKALVDRSARSAFDAFYAEGTDYSDIEREMFAQVAAAVLAELERSHVLIERGRWERGIACSHRDIREALRMATRAGIGHEQGMLSARRIGADADRKAAEVFKALADLARDAPAGEG